MIVGLGTDIVDIRRIEGVLKRTGQAFMRRIIHASEHNESLPMNEGEVSPALVRFVASRFAAKEAAAKALGTGFTQGVSFVDVRISSAPSGKPILNFYNKSALIAKELLVTHTHLSITHEKEYAVATVILESLSEQAK